MRSFVLTVLIAGLASMAFAGDQVDNPNYKAWAALGVGGTMNTEVKMTGKMERTGVTTFTVKEITPEKVTVEVFSTLVPAGGTPQATPFYAKIDPATTRPAASKPNQTITEGDEVITVLDKKFPCHWIDTVETSEKAGTSHRRVWYNPDVPLGIVREEHQNGTNMMVRTLVELKPGK